MATDIPVGAHGEQLPTVTVVEEWTDVELLRFIQQRNILGNDKNRKTFEKAEIDGSTFLTVSGTPSFWRDEGGLPLGPSYALELLVKEIKGIKAQGNAFQYFSDVTGSVYPANTVTGEPPTLPDDLVRLKSLYRLLWEKEDSLHDGIFRAFELPLFNTETDTDTGTNPQETVPGRP
jgi:hypothetical protein